MSTSPVNLRNLERIVEGSGAKSPRLATFLLAITGAGAVLVVGLTMRNKDPALEPEHKDPLAALVAEAAAQKKADAQGKDEATVARAEIDFPEVLSDADHRTTALVAVKDKAGRLTAPEPVKEASPPPALDQIPVLPLPAGVLLAATSVTQRPKDSLSQLAVQTAHIPEEAPLAQPGLEGGFMVQVASFKDQKDADAFVKELRARGHEAFRQAANVPGRGIWHRVRIGSFKSKYLAEQYKDEFEQKERTIALVVDPDAVERQQKVRAAKLAERIRKYGAE